MANIEATYIQECEEELGAKFPESYRRAMLEQNGGLIELDSLEWTLVPIFDPTEPRELSAFDSHVISETKLGSKWNGFPNNAVVIACNMFGDYLILLRWGQKFSNRVYLWDHDVGELWCVANDMSELQRI